MPSDNVILASSYTNLIDTGLTDEKDNMDSDCCWCYCCDFPFMLFWKHPIMRKIHESG
ncbi:MAG TPA: hypothetical protein VH797_10255 [Nitrososphaeraceae archaeon]